MCLRVYFLFDTVDDFSWRYLIDINFYKTKREGEVIIELI